MFKRGILTFGSHNISRSHTKKNIDKLLAVYSEVLPKIKLHIKNQDLFENTHGDILQPLYRLR